MKETIAAFVVVGLITWGACYGLSKLSDARCGWRWNESGFNNKQVNGAGCMVEIDGHWVPESAVNMHPRF